MGGARNNNRRMAVYGACQTVGFAVPVTALVAHGHDQRCFTSLVAGGVREWAGVVRRKAWTSTTLDRRMLPSICGGGSLHGWAESNRWKLQLS